jgi:O-antigen ligase
MKNFGPRNFDPPRLQRLADGLAVALVISLPWSTSATGILAALWLIAGVPTLDLASLRRIVATPAGGLPVLFWLLAVAGTLWAIGVPAAERWDGLKSVHKFLVIPLLIVQFQRSGRAAWVMSGFLASCGALLAVSWAIFFVPSLPWPWIGAGGRSGIPVKDYIAQSAEFTVCVLLLAGIALHCWQERRPGAAVAATVLAIVFLANVFFVSASRTSLVVIPILLLLFACMKLSWKAIGAFLLVAVGSAALVWSFATETRDSVVMLMSELREFKPDGERSRSGERLEFWRKSIGFIESAPVIGHGTGTIRDQFRQSARGQTGMSALAAANPHNQIFAVAIQLGIAGTAVLVAMWLAHLLLFRGEGMAAWAGFVVVMQNVVGSLFNSHLFDFTQGWGYVIGVGVAAGAVLREKTERNSTTVS